MDLAIRDVRRHAGKFAITVVGVGLLLAVVLTMNGIYRGAIADGTWLIDNTDTDLWVVERARGGPFNESSRVNQVLYRSVAAVPGVLKASPFITYPVQRNISGRSQQFSIVGYDVFGGLGGPARIVEGRSIAASHFEAVADMKIGLRVGDRLRLGLHDYSVVGLTKGAVDTGGNALMYVALPDAQEIIYQQDNEAIRSAQLAAERAIEGQGNTPSEAERLLPLVSTSDARTISAILVRLDSNAEPDAVRKGIEQRIFLTVFTPTEERDLMMKGQLFQVTRTLNLFRSLLVIVSVVIMALIVYVLTMEKIVALATLKLIGAPNSVIIRLILEQSLTLAVFAFATAYGISALTHEHFPRRLVFQRSDTMITFAVVCVGGAIASLFGIWRALRTPPSMALGG